MASQTVAVVLQHSADDREIDRVVSVANELQTPAYHATGDGWTAISIGDGSRPVESAHFDGLPGVERVLTVSAPYRLASRELFDHRSIKLGPSAKGAIVEVGGGAPLLIAVAPVLAQGGSISPEAMVEAVLGCGGNVLCAGEFPSAFVSDGATVTVEELTELVEAARAAGLLVSVEVADARDVERAASMADVLQVGHRSMQNFSVLRELGLADRPVIMKRGLGATIEEFLLAAEYVLANGNGRVILCESGIRAHGTGWKPRFEVNALPLLKQATHLPVIADPSHSSPLPQVVPDVARAAIAAGADGLILEVEAGLQEPVLEGAMDVATARKAVADLGSVAAVMGRSLQAGPQGTGSKGNGTALPSTGASRSRLLEPNDVLHETQGTLASVIERVLGTPPRLEVMKQTRISPPYPTWLRWLLRPEGDLLVRWTRYVTDTTVLSRNLSYVDFGRVDASIMARLEAEELNLGQLFSSEEIDKFGFEFGTGVNSGEFDRLLREGHNDTKSLHPYIWRRYIAATSGRVGFLVCEALPTLVWREVLRAEAGNGKAMGEV